jgi:hypothetical protein
MSNNGQFIAKDYTGFRNGMIEVIKPTNNKFKDGSTIWELRCDCGKIIERPASRIKRVFSCGCSKRKNKGMYQILDISGLTVKNVTAIEPTKKRKHTYVVWLARCNDCGEIIEKAAYSFTKGFACHKCQKYYIDHPRPGRPIIPDNGAHVNSLYGHYRSGAKVRGIDFCITKEQAKELFEQPCFYCGVQPRETKTKNLADTYSWNGIDRVDNNIGYIIDNCVPCCFTCNMAKTTMSKDDFINWITRVYNHSVNH